MKIRTRFTISLSIFLGLLCLITAQTILEQKRIDRLLKEREHAVNLELGASELLYFSSDYLFYRERRQLSRWKSAFAEFSAELARLKVRTPQQKALLAQIKANRQRLREAFAATVATMAAGAPSGRDMADLKFIQVAWTRLAVQNQIMVFDASRLSGLLEEEVNRVRKTRFMLIMLLVGGFGVYILATFFLIHRQVLRSLAVLRAETEIIGSGNLEHRIPEIHDDEIGELSRAFNQMTANLKTFEGLVQERTTELFEARIELENAKRLSDIGTLAATVAHELRNPLAAIGMAAHNIKIKARNPALDKNLANIEKKIAESDQIISNLLFYSRLRPPRHENVSMLELVQESVDDIEKRCKKGVRIIRNLNFRPDAALEADSTQIKEVINNILNNACDALGPDGGTIEICGGRDNGFVQLSVRDTGHGIAPEILEKVFDPFFTTKAKGTGLGLSVCQQIINLHGGSIKIDGTVGQGTTVAVRLPVRRT